MVLLAILTTILVIVGVIALLIAIFGGAAFILTFADLIVCCAIIAWIIGRIIKRRS